MRDPGQTRKLNSEDQEKGKVLVAETIAEIRTDIKNLLESKGFEVITAEDGEAVMSKIEEDHPELIIVDAMLPGIDGVQLCKVLRNKQETRFLPIVLLTSKTGLEDKARGFESGADDYIIKPFHPYELLIRVRSLLAMRRLQIQASESEKLAVIRELCTALEFEISHSTDTILNCTTYLENALKTHQDPVLLSRAQTISYHTSRIKMMLSKLIEIARDPGTKVRLE